MNIKCESEIKIEELDLEYDSYQQDSQIFSDNESDFTLKAEDIKIEEIDEKVSIKSELTELEKESVLGEGLVNNGVIKSENVMMIEEKSCGHHSKSFPHNESNIPLRESIKRELEVNSPFIKSEPRESDLEFVFNEEEVKIDVIKSENSLMITKKFDVQHSFPHNESNIPLRESIKRELEVNSPFIKSEPRESDLEFVFNEEEVKIDVIKSENSLMITKKFDVQHKFMSVKNVSSLLNKVNEKGLKAHFESDKEEYFAQILTSKFPLLLLKKWSHKELKNFIDGLCLELKGGSPAVKSDSRKGDEVSRNERKKNRKNGLKKQICKYCNIDFKSKVEFKSHLKSQQCKRKFKCSHCNYESNYKSSLNSHMLRHRNTKLFKCCECNYENNYKSNLKVHMLNHTNTKLFKCYACNYECNVKKDLKRHLLIHSDKKLFKCSECTHECNDKGNMKKHMLTHTNIKLFKCSECNFESNNKRTMKNHILEHANIKLFKCSHCDYESNQKNNMKSHMLTHANFKLFKCSECLYECNNKAHMRIHMLTHTNIKLFKCCVCSYECNDKGNLRMHMLKHTNIKLFKCGLCNFEFVRKGDLKRHMLTHTNFKLLNCPECDYKCNRIDTLKDHMLTHTNIKLFKCSKCSYECNRKGSLKVHMLSHENKRKKEKRLLAFPQHNNQSGPRMRGKNTKVQNEISKR